jgi:hypothetical protein
MTSGSGPGGGLWADVSRLFRGAEQPPPQLGQRGSFALQLLNQEGEGVSHGLEQFEVGLGKGLPGPPEQGLHLLDRHHPALGAGGAFRLRFSACLGSSHA